MFWNLRKQIGSNNREKARVKVARMDEKETKRLVSTYKVIGIKDLKLATA